MDEKLREQLEEKGYRVHGTDYVEKIEKKDEKFVFYPSRRFLVDQLIIVSHDENKIDEEDLCRIIESHQREDMPLLIKINGWNDIKLSNYGKARYVKEIASLDVEFEKGEHFISSEDEAKTKEFLEFYGPLYLAVEESLIQWQKNELLFTFNKVFTHKFQYKLNGIDGAIEIEKLPDGLQLTWKEDKKKRQKKITKKEMTDAVIEKWLRPIQQKQRIKTVVSPSKTFFKQFVKTYNVRSREEKELYAQLLRYFSPYDVENVIAFCLKNKETNDLQAIQRLLRSDKPKEVVQLLLSCKKGKSEEMIQRIKDIS